jgi:Holliday junction resolvase
MVTHYRTGYDLEKRIVDRLNKSGEWLAQRAPSSKGVDVIAQSHKHYKIVFLECKNTEQNSFSISRAQVLDLVSKSVVGGAEAYVAINWRGRHDKKDSRRKLLRFYPLDVLAAKFDGNEKKSVTFKPYDYSMSFDDVFFP